MMATTTDPNLTALLRTIATGGARDLATTLGPLADLLDDQGEAVKARRLRARATRWRNDNDRAATAFWDAWLERAKEYDHRGLALLAAVGRCPWSLRELAYTVDRTNELMREYVRREIGDGRSGKDTP